MKLKMNRIFWGLFFIAAAVLLLVSQLGFLGGYSFFSMVMAVFFSACLIKSIASKSISGALFSIAFLCIIFDEALGIEMLTPWPVLGAALLGSIGCSFFYRPKKYYCKNHIDCEAGWDTDAVKYHKCQNESAEAVDGDQLDLHISFAGGIRYVNSDNFQSANIQCSFGSLKIYFDNALIQNSPAVINLDVAFGGVELYLPKTWKVIDHSDHIFGGIDEKGKCSSDAVPAVILNGTVRFSGVEIIYI